MLFFYNADCSAENPHLSADELHHALQVLRLGVGNKLYIIDGKGNLFETSIKEILPKNKNCILKLEKHTFFPKNNHHFHLAIAPTKNTDRIEWLVEKATELGVHQITFLHTDNVERRHINIERLEKIAVSALKQSQQYYLPKLIDMTKLKDFFLFENLKNNCYKSIAYLGKNTIPLNDNIPPKNNYCIMIGCEGDFSLREIDLSLENGFLPVHLGDTRLRTETAGLYATMAIKWVNECT
jgi:16S rRNA (uracil1498-N3)-methyltransferase